MTVFYLFWPVYVGLYGNVLLLFTDGGQCRRNLTILLCFLPYLHLFDSRTLLFNLLFAVAMIAQLGPIRIQLH